MQHGSVTVERRKRGSAVWCFRWREAGPDGRRIHRRIVLGTAEELRGIASARKMVIGLRHEINVITFGLEGNRSRLPTSRDITDSESLPTVTFAFRIQQKGHTQGTWKSGLILAGANIGCWTFGRWRWSRG